MLRRRGRALLASLALCGAQSVAWAQTPCPSQAQSESMENEGLRLRREGHDEAALVLFRQSYTACHGASALVRMAAAEGALGRWLEADTHIRQGRATGDAWVTANLAHIETDQATVASHLGALELLGTGPSATVLVEGRPVGSWPMHGPLPVVAGTVTFTVQAEGYVPVTRTVTVPPRATAREQVTLVPVPVVPAPVVPAPVPVVTTVPTVAPVMAPTPHPAGGEGLPTAARRDGGNGTLRALGWVSAVGAVAGLATGVVASVVRLNQWYSARDLYQQDPACHNDQGTSAYCNGLFQAWVDAGTGMAPVQIAGFTAAGVLAVTSVVLFVAGASHGEAPRPVAWRCGGGPGVIGVSCGMAFP